MPSKTPKQAKFMRAVAHGWTPSRMKSPPSRAVAQEFVEADKKYSGGFAENRYGRGGLAAMSEVDSGSERQRPLNQLRFQRGGRRINGGGRRGGGGGTSTTTYSPPPAPTPPPSPYGSEAGTTQQLLDRMGYSGPMGYLRLTSGLRQAGWEPASGSGDGDLANTMWYPPEGTLTGGGGPGGPSEPPPRIIPTDPASYVGVSAEEKAALKESPYRDQLREHQAKIAATLGSARGGHVTGYAEGGTTRADNPFDPVQQKYQWRSWERKYGRDPDAPEVAVTEEVETVAAPVEEDGGMMSWLRGLFIDDPETANVEQLEERMKEMEQARGGRVGYQTGGLAMAAPSGGVPPWVEPTGTGPSGYMTPEGFQFGGIADRFNPPAAAPAAGPVPPSLAGRAAPDMGGPAPVMQRQMEQAQSAFNPQIGGPRGGVMGGPAGQRPGGLAAMQQQRGFLRNIGQPAPGGVAPSGRGFLGRAARGDYGPGTSRQYRMSADEYRGATDAQRRAAEITGGMGGPGGGSMGAIMAPTSPEEAEWQRRNYGPNEMDKRIMALRRGMGRDPNPMPGGGGVGPGMAGTLGGPGYGEYPLGSAGPRMDPSDPRYRAAPPPGSFLPGEQYPGSGSIPPWKRRSRIAPPPGKFPQGDERGPMIPGGPMVPPNQRGYLQRQRMMNRPPSGPVGGGGGNRVGMADQQGALSRAMQRGTGRAPPSRRFGRGRAGAGRGFQQP